LFIKICHSHFVHVAFVSRLVFQTFNRMIFGRLSFPGTSCYVMTYGTHKWCAIRKSWEPPTQKNSRYKPG